MMKATVMETSTAVGAATSMGMTRASRGTAIKASPNPRAERTRVAVKRTRMTGMVIE